MSPQDNYSKTCWYCKNDTMECRGSYYQCSKCGATWNETPPPGPMFIECGRDQNGNMGAYHVIDTAVRTIQHRDRKKSNG
jgi:tRNA(Ile2) C34 agmatinyltransferase TiaS